MLSGVESHTSLDVGEKYKAYVRKVYTKVKNGFPDIDLEYSKKFAVRAMNDTAGQNGIVPTLPVFGVMQRILVARKDRPGMMETMQAMKAVRKEMAEILARNPISKEVQYNVPAAADKEMYKRIASLWTWMAGFLSSPSTKSKRISHRRRMRLARSIRLNRKPVAHMTMIAK